MIEIKEKTLEDKTFIDLFAGLGGFRLALESLGARCVYSSEWDVHAQEVYRKNFGVVPAGDITKIDEKTIPDHDILCAGFPCQAFSISGKQKGFKDSRGSLFFEVARIVKEKRPELVFMENVKNFERHDGGRTFQVIQTTMEELGYNFFSEVLNAADYGVPQRRERVYMVCFRKDLKIKEFTFPKGFPLEKSVEDILLKETERLGNGREAKTELADLYVTRKDIYMKESDGRETEKKNRKNTSIRLGTVNKGGQGERIYSIKGAAITLSADGGGAFAKTGGYLVDGRPRKLHPRECARLMGYPESYQIAENPNQAYKQFGNSVVIDVLQRIAMEFSKALPQNGTNPKDSEPF